MKFFLHCQSASRSQSRQNKGFTLLEILVVLFIAGILGAIVAPTWGWFLANRQVIYARDELRQGIQQAQVKSITNRSSWRFSLRQRENHWEWTIHPNEQNWEDVSGWQPLNANIQLEISDTTLAQKNGVYYVRFGFMGEVKYRLSTVTVTTKNGLSKTRCVVISTLLGATRNGKEHSYANGNDRYCY